MDKDGNTPEKKCSSVEFKHFPTHFHTWGFPVFVLEAPLQGGTEGIPKWETREITRVYLGNYPFHAESVDLVLNTRTGHVPPQ